MINLLEETMTMLAEHGKSEKDIVWLGCNDFQITWENFKEVAAKANYDNGYGSPQVAQDLKIVGINFEVLRYEDDGKESWDWWEGGDDYPSKTIKITALTVDQANQNGQNVRCGWLNLTEMNGIDLSEHDDDQEWYDMMIQRQMMDDYNRQIGIGINNNK